MSARRPPVGLCLGYGVPLQNYYLWRQISTDSKQLDRFRYLRLRAREVAILRTQSWATAEGVPLFSVASIWEVAIKFSKGRSDFQVPPVTLRRGLLRNGYAEVPIEGGAAEVVQSLPAIHGDPFDRMLVAQARVLGVPLWTCDAKVSEYGPGVRLI